MALIDIDKFVASIMYRWNNPEMKTIFNDMKYSLIDQGLEYKDSEIVKTQRRVSAEAKEAGYGESEDEEIVKLADEYYNKVLIKECGMEEKEAHHCRVSYIHGAKAMLAWIEKQGQKSTWSEEDDSMFQSCIGAVATNDYYKGEEKEQIYDWLKSLKQRLK